MTHYDLLPQDGNLPTSEDSQTLDPRTRAEIRIAERLLAESIEEGNRLDEAHYTQVLERIAIASLAREVGFQIEEGSEFRNGAHLPSLTDIGDRIRTLVADSHSPRL